MSESETVVTMRAFDEVTFRNLCVFLLAER